MRFAVAALASLTLLACSSSPTNTGGGAGSDIIVTLTADPSAPDGGIADIAITVTGPDGGDGTGTVHVYADYGSLNESGNSEVDLKLNTQGEASATLDCTMSTPACVATKVKVTAVWEGIQASSGTGAGEVGPPIVGPNCNTSYALHFDGTQALLVGDKPLLRPTNMTVEAWFRLDKSDLSLPPTDYIALICKPDVTPPAQATEDSWAVWFQIGDLYGASMATDTFTGAGYPWNGDYVWHQVAYTFDATGNAQTVYLDGAQVASLGEPTAIAYDSSPLVIGGDINDGTFEGLWVGDIADVRLFSVVRTPAEIAQDFTVCLTGSEPNLIAAWPMQEGSGTVAHDISPNHLDADFAADGGILGPTWVVGR